MKPNETILSRLESDYNVPEHIKLVYADMLVSRAVRFYLENHLDSSVVSEDLIAFCKECGDELDMSEEPYTHFNPEDEDHKAVVEYCNLDHSIEHEKKYQQHLIGYNVPKK